MIQEGDGAQVQGQPQGQGLDAATALAPTHATGAAEGFTTQSATETSYFI